MTQRARKRQRRSRRSVGRKILLALGVVAALAGIALGSVGIWALDVAARAPSIDSACHLVKGGTSAVFAADGTRLGYIQSDDIRVPVPLERIPRNLQQATIAIEDENFREHSGVDYEAIVRAAWENLKAGHTVQGGSTITQQLVRNLCIQDPAETIERKIIEAKLAEELEDAHGKNWILQQYLNTASYGTTDGRTAIGVAPAAQTYFSKGVADLDLPQAALLAGLPQAPSEYNPLLNPDGALGRRNEVLHAMLGQGYISQDEYEQAVQAGLELNRSYRYETIREPYFFDYVEQKLIGEYGVNTVRQGGLRVYTTIQPRLQAAAQEAIATHPYDELGGPSRALVSVDPENGSIVAMASSSAYSQSKFNLAAQGHRQPGSSFKTFVLTDAIKQGVDPNTTYYNGTSPVTLKTPGGSTWTVNNAEPGGGTMSITSATAASVNAIFAQLDLDLGPETVTETAKEMGITSPLYSYPAEAIGGLRYGVSPLEMANAYATLADGGIRNTPTAIARVEFPNGETDTPGETSRKRVFSDGVAYDVTRVLEGVITGGTRTAANIGCYNGMAGKTGTTEENTDAWFVGFTPKYSTAVWVGFPDARISLGSGSFGGTLAAPIWHDFMAVANSECDTFPEPENPVTLSTFVGDHTVVPQPVIVKPGKGSKHQEPGDNNSGQTPDQFFAPGTGGGGGTGGGSGGGGGNGGTG